MLGNFVSGLGTQAALIALPYRVYVETRSALLTGLLGARRARTARRDGTARRHATLFPVLAISVYGAGASGTGLLFASVSAGAVVAALTARRLDHVRRLGIVTIAAVWV